MIIFIRIVAWLFALLGALLGGGVLTIGVLGASGAPQEAAAAAIAACCAIVPYCIARALSELTRGLAGKNPTRESS